MYLTSQKPKPQTHTLICTSFSSTTHTFPSLLALLLGGASPVVSVGLFLLFFLSNGLLIHFSFFGCPALHAPANGGQYFIALSSGVALRASMSKLQVTFASAGYCLLQHSVVHQNGMALFGFNPSIHKDFTIAIM